MKRAHVTRLRRTLKQSGLTQNGLARQLGISHAHLSGILNGFRQPSLELALKLEAKTGIPIGEFLKAS